MFDVLNFFSSGASMVNTYVQLRANRASQALYEPRHYLRQQQAQQKFEQARVAENGRGDLELSR